MNAPSWLCSLLLLTDPAALADEGFDLLAGWLPGVYDTSEQVKHDQARGTTYRHVSAVVRIVAFDGSGAGFASGQPVFYLEQALAEQPAQPYRQRVLALEQTGPGTYTLWDHRISEPRDLVGAGPEALKAIKAERLTRDESCSVVFVRADGELFKGAAGAGGSCKSTLRGATHVVSYSELTPRALISLDQGFDDQGAHKWGPPPGVIGHIFRKR